MRLKSLLVHWICIIIFFGAILSFQVQGKRRKGKKKKEKNMADDLNYQLRSYSKQYVKIQESDYDWAKSLVNEYVRKAMWEYIRQNSDLPLRNLEYTGSQYEHLKTEAADEVDVMIVLEAKKHMTVEEVNGVPGWVKLRVHKTDSPYMKFTNSEKYILPEVMLLQWLFSIVTKARNFLQKKFNDLPVSFEVRRHGPAVQLDIIEISTEKKLSVDLVLSFGFEEHQLYVAKPYKIKKPNKHPPCSKDVLLRKSFSTVEKATLRDMDSKDSGCRHELLRIVKTIVRNDSALKGKLTTYHLKTAFLWFNQTPKSWHRDELGKRFLEYIQYLVDALKKKKLQHYWVHEVNLLEDIDSVVISNMVGRLQRLLSSEIERSKVLKVPAQDVPSLSKKTSQLSLKEEGILDLLRTFVDDMGKSLSEIIKSSKKIFNICVKDFILKNCKDKDPDLISKFEYSGNLYESLIAEGTDDDDVLVLVVLKKKSSDVTPSVLHEGYGKFKMQGPKYEKFSDSEGFVCPAKIQKWFFKTIKEEAERCRREFGFDIRISQPVKDSPMKLEIKYGNPTCQGNELCSNTQAASNKWVKSVKSSLTVSLVPAFEVERSFFVPIQPSHLVSGLSGANNNWKRSFSLEIKGILQEMDKDGGCRHDLYRVVNTILKREPTFSNLLPHMKMLFVVYIKESIKIWEKSKLGERFEEFFSFLANLLKTKRLKHFWLQDVNLLSDVPDITIDNMEKRVMRILNSKQERQKILKY